MQHTMAWAEGIPEGVAVIVSMVEHAKGVDETVRTTDITEILATGITIITRKTIMACLASLVPAQHLVRRRPPRLRLSPTKQRLFNRRRHRRLLRRLGHRLRQIQWE